MADQALTQNAALTEPNHLKPSERGECVIPGKTKGTAYLEHLGGYEFASRSVKGKAALDVACGAGHRAQILPAAGTRNSILIVGDRPTRQRVRFHMVQLPKSFARIAKNLVQGRPRSAQAVLCGLIDGYRGIGGRWKDRDRGASRNAAS